MIVGHNERPDPPQKFTGPETPKRPSEERVWVDCTKIAGSGTVKASVADGVVKLAGAIHIRNGGAGSITDMVKLPDSIPRPAKPLFFPVHAINTGVAYRIATAQVHPNGSVGGAGTTGVFDIIELDNISYEVP